jgi:site-specific DNA-methyltransferase (adenine-specific)
MWIYSSGFPKSQDIGKSIARSEKKVKNTKTYLPDIDDNRNVSNSTTGSPRCQMCDKSTGPIWKKCPDDRADCIRPWEADQQDNEWNGWGTQLKPAHEPIALARKPIKLSIARNCQTHGVGALNIDACRVPYDGEADQASAKGFGNYENLNRNGGPGFLDDRPSGGSNGWSRVGFSEQPVEKYSDQKKSTKPSIGTMGKAPPNLNAIGTPSTIETSDQPRIPSDLGRFPSNVIGEIPLYQKYFYCPKVSRRERHIGMEDPGPQTARARDAEGNVLNYAEKVEGASPTMLAERFTNSPGNNHPTVKPIELMKYLIRLITPAGGTVLDPFNGSGSTGCAAVELGMEYIGCELDERYVEIADKRIRAWYEHCNPTTFNQLFERAA